jgi:hypothetical protein
MVSKASTKRAAKLIKTYERMMKLWESFNSARYAFERAQESLSRPYKGPGGWTDHDWDKDALEIAAQAGYEHLAKASVGDLLA